AERQSAAAREEGRSAAQARGSRQEGATGQAALAVGTAPQSARGTGSGRSSFRRRRVNAAAGTPGSYRRHGLPQHPRRSFVRRAVLRAIEITRNYKRGNVDEDASTVTADDHEPAVRLQCARGRADRTAGLPARDLAADRQG